MFLALRGRCLLRPFVRPFSTELKPVKEAPIVTATLLEEAKLLHKNVQHTIRNPFPRNEYIAKQNRLYEVAQQATEMGSVDGKVRLAECVLWGFGIRSNPKMALEMLEPLAKGGYAPALTLAGKIYEKGLNNEHILPEHKAPATSTADGRTAFVYVDNRGEVIRDPALNKTRKEIVKEARKTQKQLHLEETRLVEEAYNDAIYSKPMRMRKAREYFQEAIAKEYVPAMIELGNLCKAEDKDEEAVKYFQMAADKKDPMGYFYLAEMYFNGSGVEKDKKKAYKLFNMAASLGSEDACFFLGYSYLGGELIDEKNSEEGMRLLREAMRKEHAGATYYIALMYLNGNAPVKKNLTKFRFLAEKAAHLGHADAVYCLGDMYYKGNHGVDIDYPKALMYFLEAARYKHALGAYAAGVMFYNGIGTEKNGTFALEMYSDAASFGLPLAMRTLGVMYKQGDFTPKNVAIGEQWLEMADDIEKANFAKTCWTDIMIDRT